MGNRGDHGEPRGADRRQVGSRGTKGDQGDQGGPGESKVAIPAKRHSRKIQSQQDPNSVVENSLCSSCQESVPSEAAALVDALPFNYGFEMSN